MYHDRIQKLAFLFYLNKPDNLPFEIDHKLIDTKFN